MRTGVPQQQSAGGVNREHHPELVLWQQQGHAHTQLPLPRGRRSSGPHQQAQGEAESQVSTALPCQSACCTWQADASQACVERSLTSTTLAGEGPASGRHIGARRSVCCLLMHKPLRSLTCDQLWYRYELSHVVRTHMGASDASYTCVYQQEDEDGATGVHVWTSEVTYIADSGVLTAPLPGSLMSN